jgi:hypothetical protein
MNRGLARTIGTLMKLDFRGAVLNRIPLMEREPAQRWREVLFLCDESQSFATVGRAIRPAMRSSSRYRGKPNALWPRSRSARLFMIPTAKIGAYPGETPGTADTTDRHNARCPTSHALEKSKRAPHDAMRSAISFHWYPILDESWPTAFAITVRPA